MPATNTHTITDIFKDRSSALRLRAFVCKTMHHSPSGAGLPRPQPSTRQWRLCIRTAAPLGLWCIILQTNARDRSALLFPLKVSVIVCVFVAGIPSVRRVDYPRCNICQDICLLCNEQEHASCGRSFCKRTPAIEACCSSSKLVWVLRVFVAGIPSVRRAGWHHCCGGAARHLGRHVSTPNGRDTDHVHPQDPY